MHGGKGLPHSKAKEKAARLEHAASIIRRYSPGTADMRRWQEWCPAVQSRLYPRQPPA
nr:MAG TPA: hypothetical protein [Caudoviricetes sp.]